MIKKTTPILLLLLIFCANVSVAQVGITSVPFLQIEPDSRAAGMGNTGVAIADNASAVFWNPAGLGFQTGNQVSITHSQWLPQFNADLFYDYLVGKFHIENVGTFGAHVTYLNLGEQIRTDGDGFDQGRFNSYEFAGGISYGVEVHENWALGTGLRFIYSSLAEGELEGGETIKPGQSFSFDLSGLYKSNTFGIFGRDANINAGLNLSNIGPGVNYTSNANKDPLPTVLRIGWALTTNLDKQGINTLTIANDYSKVMARVDENGEPEESFSAIFSSWDSFQRDNGQQNVTLNLAQQFMVATGLEYWYNDLFSVRGGYYYEDPNNGDRQFITLGAGIRYDFLGVDFSYIYTLKEDHPLANTTRFGLLIDF